MHTSMLVTSRLQRGFSLVEAMVALMVLSIGMLGIAGLYVESLRAGRTAIYRTQAINLASDMAERIRANAQAGDMGQALDDPGKIADPVPVRILEAAGIDLVDHHAAPPVGVVQGSRQLCMPFT